MHTHTCTVPPKATVAHQNVMAARYTVVHIPSKFSRSSSHKGYPLIGVYVHQIVTNCLN